MPAPEQPVEVIFRMYILDLMGALPVDRIAALEKMRLPDIFKTKARDWRGAIKEALHLSDTFEVAAWNIWISNREKLGAKAAGYTVEAYARDFASEYQKPDSRIDRWTDETLAAARVRMARARSQ